MINDFDVNAVLKTGEKQIIETFGEEDTFLLGKKIGENAFPGMLITLIGDLGVGKTVFAKGLAVGLNIGEDI